MKEASTTDVAHSTTPAEAKLSRRDVLKVAGAATAAGALAATRPKTGWTKNVYIQGEPITLTYWHGWTEQWSEMVQYVVDQFHTFQSRIKVEPVVVPVTNAQQGAEFLAKLTAAISAGEPPDIVTLFGSTAIPTFANQEALIALDDIDGGDLPAVQAWMDPNVYKLGQYEGKTYGLSYWAGCYALIYNQATFEEVGLDPAVGPATIADLDAMADQLTTRDGDGNISRMGFAPSQENFWLYGTMFGGTFFDDAANKVTANDRNNVAALEWMQSYPEKYDPNKLAAFQEGLANERAQNLDPLISGKYALQLQGPWKLGDIRKYGDPNFRYGVARPPLATPEAPAGNWTWGDIQIIPTGSKDAAAAAEFVKFTAGVIDPEGYATRCTWGNRPINIPVSRSVLDVPSFQQVVADYPGFDVFIDALLNGERVGSPPVMPAAAYYNDRMVSTVERVMLLDAEPQAALDELTEDVQAELERME